MAGRKLEEEVARAMGSAVRSSRAVSGGDINSAHEMTLADGRVVFVKSNSVAAPTMFAAEARGLAWLAQARACAFPRFWPWARLSGTRAHLAGAAPAGFRRTAGPRSGSPAPFGAPGFGLDHDNFIGRLPQSNTPAPSWSDFYRSRRLEPQLRLARDAGLCSSAMARGFDRLFAVLDERVGPAEPVARLHGDLWGGNVIGDAAGLACLIDPAVYGGHREVDLAMMRLFGGFGHHVFSAYEEAWPLSPGHEDRVPLYQLYFLMVHVNLFGGSYVAQAERALLAVA
jgi:protein-ribulosamine 3-kinase